MLLRKAGRSARCVNSSKTPAMSAERSWIMQTRICDVNFFVGRVRHCLFYCFCFVVMQIVLSLNTSFYACITFNVAFRFTSMECASLLEWLFQWAMFEVDRFVDVEIRGAGFVLRESHVVRLFWTENSIKLKSSVNSLSCWGSSQLSITWRKTLQWRWWRFRNGKEASSWSCHLEEKRMDIALCQDYVQPVMFTRFASPLAAWARC